MITQTDILNLKSTSILNDLKRRELFGLKKYSWTCAKNIPNDLIQYFECPSSSSYQLVNDEFELIPPYACAFSRYPEEGNIGVVSLEDGTLMMINLYKKSSAAILDQWSGHRTAIYDVKWLTCDRHFLTASADHTICLHDAQTKKKLVFFFGHTSSVKSLSLQPDSMNVFASGSRDSSLRIWDSRNLKTVRDKGREGIASVIKVLNCHQPEWTGGGSACKKGSSRKKVHGSTMGSVTSVLYQSEHCVITAGSTDGNVKLWDTRKLTTRGQPLPRQVLAYAGTSQKSIGYSDMVATSSGSHLFAYCLDGVIYQYNLFTHNPLPVYSYSGHSASSFYLKQSLSPDNRFLACGSSDNTAHIYPVSLDPVYRYQPPACNPVVLRGHSKEVTVVSWCPTDPSRLVTMADDCCMFIWETRPERRYRLAERGQLVGMAESNPTPYISVTGSLNPTILSPQLSKTSMASPLTSISGSQVTVSTSLTNTPTSGGLMPRRSASARSSMRLRQVNIVHFLKSPLISNQENVPPPVPGAFSNHVQSPRKLLLSPNKMNILTPESCLSSCLPHNNTQAQEESAQEESSQHSASTSVRKRLRFDFSTTSETLANEKSTGSLQTIDINANHLANSPLISTPGMLTRKRRLLSPTDENTPPQSLSNKRHKYGDESLPGTPLRSTVFKRSPEDRRSGVVSSPRIEISSFETPTTPLSIRNPPGTPKTGSARRRSRKNSVNSVPITSFFKPT